MNAVNVPIHSRTREKCCSDARAEMKSAEKCRDANASFLLSADVTRMFPSMSHARSVLNGFNQRAICVKLRNWCIRVSICETGQRDQRIMTAQDSTLGDTDDKIFVGKGNEQAWLTLAFANRHGLVTGATGTGKTVSLQVMAEGFATDRGSGVRGRHQGRPLRHLRGWRAGGFHRQARHRDGTDVRARPVLDGVLGRV